MRMILTLNLTQIIPMIINGPTSFKNFMRLFRKMAIPSWAISVLRTGKPEMTKMSCSRHVTVWFDAID